MAVKSIKRSKRAERRRARVRGKITGTEDRPRLTVAKSLKNVFVQIIDDVHAVTLVAASSNSKNVAEAIKPEMTKTDVARKVGEVLAREAKAKGIESVVFDRNRFRYHGRVKAVAEGARSGGLKL